MMRSIVLFVLCSTLFFGCGLQRFLGVPDPQAETRAHPLGVEVYNESGTALEEWEWRSVFFDIDRAYKTLYECVGGIDRVFDKGLRTISIVLLPPDPIIIVGKEYTAYTNFRSVFVRRDRAGAAVLRHEWLHIYRAVVAGRPFGDFLHRSRLFELCRYLD